MHTGIKALLLFTLMLTFCVIVLGLRTTTSGIRNAGQQDTIDESQFPIAGEAEPGPSTPAERTKKRAKEKKYQRYKDKIGDGVTIGMMHDHWPPGFTTLPVAQSDAVVIGEVSNAKAYLTDDKSAVYSEFTVRVDKVLKDDRQSPLSPGGSIVAERPGGRVRYPSGNIARFSLAGRGMPRVARRYVLFLTRNKEGDEYHLVTGYELRDGRVIPLDSGMTPDGARFDAYVGMEEAPFFRLLDTSLATSSPTEYK
jgi:hypothetical protein